MTSDRLTRAQRADVALAVAVAALMVVNSLLPFSVNADPGPVDYALLLGGTLVLAARRHAPVVVLVVAAALILGYYFRVHPDFSASASVLVAVYTAVRAGHRLVPAAATVLFLAGTLTDHLQMSDGLPFGQALQQFAVLPLGWFVAAFVLAEAWRHREAELEQRAAEAERSREETARRRALDERLRIARELHDSLTHSISVIKVQAGVAAHLAQKRGEPVPAALAAIEAASRDATRELRSTLDVLRTDSDGSGLDRLPDLVERARAAGVTAEVTVDGTPRTLPVEIDRAVYRIVQEALTNVGRHSAADIARVRIDYRPDELTVQVDDDGPAGPDGSASSGVGLTGMRERVEALGGRLSTGPHQGGFRVRAALPIAESW